MGKKIAKIYFKIPLFTRILVGFALGIIAGLLLWHFSQTMGEAWLNGIIDWISPFGNILIGMMKMAVIPIVFFSLVTGSASLPMKKLGSIGAMVLLWFTVTSFMAATLGTGIALLINPGKDSSRESIDKLAQALMPQAQQIGERVQQSGNRLAEFVGALFKNPFEALSTNNFLAIIIFAMLFGLAIRVLIDTLPKGKERDRAIVMLDLFHAAQDAIFKIVDWVMEYFPFGVFALTMVNFALYGSKLFGPYMKIAIGVILGIIIMIFVIYPILIFFFTSQNPLKVMARLQEPIISAFVTRSSAAALPVSMRVCEEELGVRNELAGFSLPLGCTINMDGVCIHLPVFAILAANLFNVNLGLVEISIMIVSVVLAAVGAGGVPSGSLMLMFIVLQNMGLTDTQTAVIVALAMGINPIIDMFETAANVAGDNVCTYIVANNQDMIRRDG